MNIYELIGFIIGDGNIYYNSKKRKYRLELCGNIEEDFDYFEQINNFLKKESGSKPLFFSRQEKKGKSLRIQFNNKEFVEKLIKMGLPKGKKTFTILIPNHFLNNRKIMLSILRGLFEADGCFYFSRSKKINYPSYPRLEIKTSSPILVGQIKSFLEGEGFIVYLKKPIIHKTYALLLSGEEMLEKWRQLIGFVSLKNQSKYKLWKTKGFYIPYTPLKNRQELCAGGTTALRPISS